MDKRPNSEEKESVTEQTSKGDETNGVPQETKASAEKYPVTEDGEDDPSEVSKFKL